MAAVRYVVVSDLHLGAAYSLLTHTDADGNPHPDQLSATGRGVSNGMRSLFGALQPGQAPLPTLVLLGDIFDLSFVPARVAMMAFQQLVLELFDPARPALFDATVLYVPGNHDHREWRVIRDAMFLEQVRGESAGELPERPATTGLLAQPVECQVATALMRRALGDDRYRVESGYPNVGFVAGDRCVVMHHGHFTEGTYRLMSTALGQLTGQDTTTDLDELERINGPWIDFFWSSFGDQGSELSSDVFTLYEIMLDANASHVAIQDISGKLLTLLGSRFGLHAESPITTKWGSVTVGGVVTAALDVGVAQAAGTERFYQRSALSAGSAAGVQWYLSGPVRRQLDALSWPGNPPSDCAFVFGHTHKPFQDQMLVPGYRGTVDVWNTGGWVVDRPLASPVQGAAAVIIDSDANIASLRLFNNPINDDMAPVRVEGSHGPEDARNPLLQALTHALASDTTMFDEFSEACHDGLRRRAAWLRARFMDRDAMRGFGGVTSPSRSRGVSTSTPTTPSTALTSDEPDDQTSDQTSVQTSDQPNSIGATS